MTKKGPIILVSVFIAFCFSLVMLFRASSQLASASELPSLLDEITDTYDDIVELRAKKEAGCKALSERYPDVALPKICPLSPITGGEK